MRVAPTFVAILLLATLSIGCKCANKGLISGCERFRLAKTNLCSTSCSQCTASEPCDSCAAADPTYSCSATTSGTKRVSLLNRIRGGQRTCNVASNSYSSAVVPKTCDCQATETTSCDSGGCTSAAANDCDSCQSTTRSVLKTVSSKSCSSCNQIGGCGCEAQFIVSSSALSPTITMPATQIQAYESSIVQAVDESRNSSRKAKAKTEDQVAPSNPTEPENPKPVKPVSSNDIIEELDQDSIAPNTPIENALPALSGLEDDEPSNEPTPVKAKPVSTEKTTSPVNFAPTPPAPLPATPLPETPVQDPVRERLAVQPPVIPKYFPRIPEPPQTEVQAQPVVQPKIEMEEQPIVLKARPSNNHYFSAKQYARPEVAQRPIQRAVVPVHQSSHRVLPVHNSGFQPQTQNPNYSFGLPTGAVEFRDLPQFESPTVSKRAATDAHLRVEAEKAKAKEAFFDVQALISHEIDKRIREGKLQVVTETTHADRPVTEPPSIEQSIIEKPGADSPVDEAPLMEDVTEPVTTLQPIEPQFEMDVFDDEPVSTPVLDSEVNRPKPPVQAPVAEFPIAEEFTPLVEIREPNLYIPVLEVNEEEPIIVELPKEMRPVADPVIKLNVDSTPIQRPQDSQARMGTLDLESLENQLQPIESESILRLRAFSQPNVKTPQPSVVRFRNVSTEYQYQGSTNPGINSSMPRIQTNVQPTEFEPNQEPIQTIKAQPINRSDAMLEEIRGLTELPQRTERSKARIIDR